MAGGSPVPDPPPDRNAARARRIGPPRSTLAATVLLLTCLVQTFVARVYEIPSQSMEKTLHGCDGCTDDRVLVDRLAYRFADPSPGDVVVFAPPPSWAGELSPPKRSANPALRWMENTAALIGLGRPDDALIKRVIAVGGQTGTCPGR
jgi:signal peptidase I